MYFPYHHNEESFKSIKLCTTCNLIEYYIFESQIRNIYNPYLFTVQLIKSLTAQQKMDMNQTSKKFIKTQRTHT